MDASIKMSSVRRSPPHAQMLIKLVFQMIGDVMVLNTVQMEKMRRIVLVKDLSVLQVDVLVRILFVMENKNAKTVKMNLIALCVVQTNTNAQTLSAFRLIHGVMVFETVLMLVMKSIVSLALLVVSLLKLVKLHPSLNQKMVFK